VRRSWMTVGAAVLALLVSSTGPAVAAPDEPDGEVERAAGSVAAASTPVPLPDLGLSYRRSDGGMNLFRLPLSELEDGYGTPQLVRTLSGRSGYTFDGSRVLAGDIADFTADDDGTADHLIWLRRNDGGVSVGVVAGGGSTVPRYLMGFSARWGWSWATPRPTLGDVTGDGWDDLIVRRPTGTSDESLYVFPSTGTSLGAPVLWQTDSFSGGYPDAVRNVVADVDGDGFEDSITVKPWVYPVSSSGLQLIPWLSTGTAFPSAGPVSSQDLGPFDYRYSRQLAGDVDGDGMADIVTVHRAGNGTIRVFVHPAGVDGGGVTSIGLPQLWQSLGGSWSYDYSRQYLADTDADGYDDLISVLRTSRGIAVFRHLSDGSSFGPPELVAHLIGWNWSLSRESVADTWGLLVN
jgi:hypothetical protein